MIRIILFLTGLIIICIGCSAYDSDLKGTVNKKNSSNHPLSDVKIISGNQETSTSDEGNFHFSGEVRESNPTIKLYLSKKNYKSKVVSVDLKPKSEGSTDLTPDMDNYEDDGLQIEMETNQ